MTTVAELIGETRGLLYSGQSENMNRLNGAVTDSQTSLTFRYDVGGIQRGTVICIDLEEILVWEVSGQQATVVQRGVNGSVATAHDDLDIVYIQPKFSDFRILRALNQDLNDLSSPYHGMFQVLTSTLTYNAAIDGYNLTGSTNVLSILDIDYDTPGPEKNLPAITSWVFRRHANVTDFPTGNAIVINNGGFPGKSVRVRYSSPYGQWASLSDTHTTVGLQATAVDLPPIGAALRLVAPRDVKRAFTEHQGDTRRAEEVPPGSSSEAMRGLAMLRRERITAEQARLQAMYPKSLIW